MGNLTRDIERLCNEIHVSRESRSLLKQEIAAYNEAIKRLVSEMCSGFASEHQTMSVSTKQTRMKFIASLKKDVRDIRLDTASDLAGARKAWSKISDGASRKK